MPPAARSSSLWAWAAAWIAVFLALYVVSVHTPAGRLVDERVAQATPRDPVAWFRLTGLLVGSEPLWVVVGLVVAVVIGRRRARRPQLATGLVVAGAALVLAELLKHLLPGAPVLPGDVGTGSSFPSGHTTSAAGMTVALWFVASRRRRPVVVLLGVPLCLLVGVSLVVHHWHRPGDVVAAYALVAACACAGGAVLAGRRQAEHPSEPVPSSR